jgi:hypothetical protein
MSLKGWSKSMTPPESWQFYVRRFLALVDSSGGFDSCWEWRGNRHRQGYGLISRNYKISKAHRVMWQFRNGPIPDGMCVLHRCDNPPCCNPAHLFLGTQVDNIHDMQNKGRLVVPRGEQQGNSKLTNESVRRARKEYAEGGITMRELGHRYGVTMAVMQKAIRGTYWKHVA